MSDYSPEMKRVVIELPGKDVPGLMALIGDFVTSHNLGVELSDVSGGVDPSLTAEDTLSFNPNLVSIVWDDNSGEEVAAITEGDLRAFSLAKYGKTDPGQRLSSAFFKGGHTNSTRLRPFMVMGLGGTIPAGLRVERAKELLDLVTNTDFSLNHLGSSAIGLY